MKDNALFPPSAALAAPGPGGTGAALARGGWRHGRAPGAHGPQRPGLLATACLAVTLGLLHYLLNNPPADIPTTTGTLSALAWPAPALGIALLWHRPTREWPWFLLAIGVALFLVGRLDWLPWGVDLLFALLGALEVGLGAWVARRWVSATAVLDGTRSLLRFVLLLPGALAASHALIMGGALGWTMDVDWPSQSGRIFAAQALAFLTVLPALLSAPAPVRILRRNPRAIALAVPLVLVLALLPGMPDEAVRAMLALTLAAAALRLTPLVVARLNALIAVALVGMTLLSLGPYVTSSAVDVWALQLDLIGLSLLSQGLAIAMQERRRMAQQLEQTRRIEALGFLAGGIAHDFNNLLGTIGACAEVTADQWPDGRAPQPLQMLETEVQRGREMTQQLLLAARQGDPQRSAVPLVPLLAEVVASAQALCPTHVRIELQGMPDAQVCARANASQLRRAMQNLVRNASQAARSRVLVRAGQADGPISQALALDASIGDPPRSAQVWVEVSDDGPGIDAQHWPHLFDPFYSTRQGKGGTGLGLAIVAGVACSHDGRVGMQTQAGQGTRFWLSIPQEASSP